MFRRDNPFIVYSQKNLVGLSVSYEDSVNVTDEDVTSQGDAIMTAIQPSKCIAFRACSPLMLTVLILTMDPSLYCGKRYLLVLLGKALSSSATFSIITQPFMHGLPIC